MILLGGNGADEPCVLCNIYNNVARVRTCIHDFIFSRIYSVAVKKLISSRKITL